jgi:transposase InsO family protein
MEVAEQPSDEQLREIYYKPENSGSYGGVDRLMRSAKQAGFINISRDRVQKFLHDQHAYSLHKQIKRNFKRNKTYVGGIDRQWQADLADMASISQFNDGVRFLLTVIDVFSKFAWVIPVKSKTSQSLVEAFQKLFNQSAPRRPRRLQTDKGTEFLNKHVKRLLEEQNIEHFTGNSDKKAAVVERFNRTIKHRIWRYFTAKRTYKYLDILQKMVDSYNHSVHRSIGMAPADVKPEHEAKIWVKLYGDGGRTSGEKQKIKHNQMVRVSRVKGQFEKGYLPNWSEEHFNVEESNQRPYPRKVYKLRDYSGEPVEGSWYREELQPISENKYYIDKVLKRRKTADGTRELLVKWKGWPSKFNSWISEEDLTT